MSDKREKAIKTLEDIITIAEGLKGLSDDVGITISLDKIDSLKFALESIKVDRAYDLAYEKVDFIEIPEGATNGEMIKAVFPNIEIEQIEDIIDVYGMSKCRVTYDTDWWNSPYRKEQE